MPNQPRARITHRSAVLTLRRLLKGLTTAVLTTSEGSAGRRHSRPMLLQDVDPKGHIWLMTDSESTKARDIESCAQINLTFVSPKQDRFVSVAGTATVRHDRNRIRQLWRPSYRAWYPRGRKDPSLVLVDIDPSDVDYWIVPTGRIVRILGALTALLRGRRYEAGRHGSLALR